MIKTAFVAALEREVSPLTRAWRAIPREHQGRTYKFFENEGRVLVCGGIGAEAARRATEAIIRLYAPSVVWSVGFAGALDCELKVGEALCPRCVVDAGDGSSIETGGGEGILVTYSSIASTEQKRKLGRAYGAQAIDMEAAAVARGVQARGIRFAVYKVISDESDFEIPAMERFIRNGEFRALAFVSHTLLRPWLWPRVLQLARNSTQAANALCRWLFQYNSEREALESKAPELHPMKRA